MISGSMVALVTPMDAQGALDWQALTRLVDFHLHEGTDALVVVGTSGESATLNVQEHVEVIKRVVAGCDVVLVVLVPHGVHGYSTGTAQAVLDDYAEPGARHHP